MIVFGDQYYGKVDVVPGLCYVKTRFLHIWWFPLVPRESILFCDPSLGLGDMVGVRIPLRWKSVFLAWVRAVCYLMFYIQMIVLVLFGISALPGKPKALLTQGDLPVTYFILANLFELFVTGLVYWMTTFYQTASEERAIELGGMLGMPAKEVEKRIFQNRFPDN